MVTILANRAWYDLRSTAHAHGLPFHTKQAKVQVYDRLYSSLTHEGVLRRRFKQFSEEERGALIALQSAGGTLPQHRFQKAYGAIRIYRPWRDDGTPKQPWKKPQSVAEKLWHFGFIEIIKGRPNQVALPDEVLALLPPLPRIEPAERAASSLVQSPAEVLHIDLAMLLGTLLYRDVRPLHGRWLPPYALREQVEWAQSLLSYFLEHEGETGERIDLVILNTIASGFNALGKEESALDIYNFSMELFADEPQHPALAVISFNAALVHYGLGNFDQALKLCQRSIALDEQQGNPRGIATSLLLLSDLLHAQGKVEGIFRALKRATELIEPLDNRYLHAQITAKTALHTARYHDWERAAGLFKAAIVMWRDIGDEQQLANTLFFYATLLQATGSQAEALVHAEESLRLLERLSLPDAAQVREDIEQRRSNSAE